MTEGALEIELVNPIASVSVLAQPGSDGSSAAADNLPQNGTIPAANVDSLCRSMQEAVLQLGQLYTDIFTSNREHIARLSVAIAEKILLKQIEQGSYDINLIVQEAIKNTAPQVKVAVCLNPSDLKKLNNSADGGRAELPENISLVADVKVPAAHCVVQTPMGIIDYCIEEILKQFEIALKKS